MKSMRLGMIALAVAAGTASAQPLEMTYTVDDVGGGLFNYEITLTLTNDDGTWIPGYGYGWIIFGDRLQDASPLTNFTGDPDDLPIGPFVGYSGSGGYHNGPTLQVGHSLPDGGFVFDYWVPTTIGESLHWSGTSDVDLQQGEFIWSSIITSGGAPLLEFLIANRDSGNGECPADFNGDGFVDFFDFTAFVDCFEGVECPPGRTADFNDDGFADFFDFSSYVDAFETGC